MREERSTLLVSLGGVGAAFGSALCCAGPLIAAVVGASGAGISAIIEPLRPYFLGAAAGLLLFGFWLLKREERRACEPGTPCADSGARRRMRRILWIATAFAAVFATLPLWQRLLH